MVRMIDLNTIPTKQLRAIHQILAGGNLAVAESKEVSRLRSENAELKRLQTRRDAVEGAGFDWDDPEYWMSFSDEHFEMTLSLFIRHKQRVERELSIAEATNSIRIPQIMTYQELNALDTVRCGLGEMKHRRNGDGTT
ncbi:hypothetical protein ACFLWZ_04555 [Chloroflexota bacterium]